MKKKIPSKIFFSRTESSMILKLGMQHEGIKLEVYINDDPRLTLTILRQGQIESPIYLNGEKCYEDI